MNVRKGALRSDLARADAHGVKPADYEDIPELDDDFFERAAACHAGVPVKVSRFRPPNAEKARTRLRTELEAYLTLKQSEVGRSPSPWALDHVQYLSRGGVRRMELSFLDPESPSLAIPINKIRELAAATVKDLHELHLSPARDTVISDTLDVHISVEGLIRNTQDPRSFNRLVLTRWATRGGRATGETKRPLSAENGKKRGQG